MEKFKKVMKIVGYVLLFTIGLIPFIIYILVKRGLWRDDPDVNRIRDSEARRKKKQEEFDAQKQKAHTDTAGMSRDDILADIRKRVR